MTKRKDDNPFRIAHCTCFHACFTLASHFITLASHLPHTCLLLLKGTPRKDVQVRHGRVCGAHVVRNLCIDLLFAVMRGAGGSTMHALQSGKARSSSHSQMALYLDFATVQSGGGGTAVERECMVGDIGRPSRRSSSRNNVSNPSQMAL